MFFILAPAAVLLLAAIAGWVPQTRTHPRTARTSWCAALRRPRTLTLAVGGMRDLEVRATAATAACHSDGFECSRRNLFRCVGSGRGRSWVG